MTVEEFGEWLDYHGGLDPSFAKWLADLPDRSHTVRMWLKNLHESITPDLLRQASDESFRSDKRLYPVETIKDCLTRARRIRDSRETAYKGCGLEVDLPSPDSQIWKDLAAAGLLGASESKSETPKPAEVQNHIEIGQLFAESPVGPLMRRTGQMTHEKISDGASDNVRREYLDRAKNSGFNPWIFGRFLFPKEPRKFD